MKTVKELCNIYESCDSVSERETLEEQIESICRKYLDLLYKNSLEFGIKSIFDMSDYRDDRGSLSFDDCSESGLWVRYTDSWSYGGNCDEKCYIKFEDIDSFDDVELKNKSIEEARKNLERDITSLEKQVKAAELSLLKFNMIHKP